MKNLSCKGRENPGKIEEESMINCSSVNGIILFHPGTVPMYPGRDRLASLFKGSGIYEGSNNVA